MKLEDLLREIETAFEDVRREEGVTLHEAMVIDLCGSEHEQREARSRDTDMRWQDVPDEDIEDCFSALCYLDIKGFRYYLPAYMRWSLKHYKTSQSLSVDSPIYALVPWKNRSPRPWQIERWSAFTEVQCCAILNFLRFMAEKGAGYADENAAQQAIDGYWNQYG